MGGHTTNISEYVLWKIELTKIHWFPTTDFNPFGNTLFSDCPKFKEAADNN